MSGGELGASCWVIESISPHDAYYHGVTRVLDHRRTAFQEMLIIESGSYGKALVLDGKWQSSAGDEFLYHEPLVHVAAAFHGKPENVLVLGGGEGATVREVLKWNSVHRVVMVDIDGEVVEACKKHLPEMHQGAFDDPRTELVIGDALGYLDETEPTWDLIISDLSDPIEQGPSFKLFTREYFDRCKRVLRTGGYFVVQAGPLAPAEMHLHVRLFKTVESVFDHTVNYQSCVPTYASPWGFIIGSDVPMSIRPEPEAIDAVLASQTTGSFRMLDGRTVMGMLQIPRHIRQAIDCETQIYTLEKPPRFFGAGVAAQ